MARGERNARHDDRFPAVDPFFDGSGYGAGVGYSMADARDYTGYAIQDSQLPMRLGELPFDPEVKAALGGELVGRVSVASYGNAMGPVPGSYVQGLDPYPLYGFNSEGAAPAGAVSTRQRLGVPPSGMDDTSFAGVGEGMFLTGQHAIGAVRAPGLSGDTLVEHVRSYANAGIYDGGDGTGYGVPSARGGGGDFGSTSASQELAVISRKADAGDEFTADGWDERPTGRRDRSGNVFPGRDYDR